MGRPRYEALDHIADAQVRIFGDTLEELFANAAYALFNTMADIGTVCVRERRALPITADDLEHLLHAWLSDLLFLFATRQMLLSEFDVRSVNPQQITATVGGERLDLQRHTFYTEIKAVTYHQLRIEPRKDGWVAEVIFDI